MTRHAWYVALGLALLAGAARAEDPFLRRTTTVRVVEEAGPAVVNITTEQTVQSSPFRPFGSDPFFDRFFRDFFEPRMPQTVQNLGSGVVIDAEGHILTNEHVIARASRIRASLADGREFDATLVGADPNNDIAVLKIETDAPLPWIAPGHSNDLMVGEPVIAIGNPFGLSHTVTTGVISAINRSIRTDARVYHGFLQIDASINPGNSGGPLLNAEGSLVGINTAVYGNAQGIGFAIPIDTAQRVVSELIEHGEISPVWIGLELQDLDPRLLEALGLPPGTLGALVNRVRDTSPAQRAGLRRGDVLTRVDGQPLESARSFYERLDTVTVGQKLELTLQRDGAVQRLTVQAEELPEAFVARLVEELTGLALAPAARGGYQVQSVRSGSGGDRVGLQQGDLVLGINGRALEDESALRRAVLHLRGQSQALLVVQRGAGRYHVALPLL
ncbi:MAG: trypsin-like peptidase domain-containing protein [Myxococcales bacterium]|nr:trypsin-like peptidase domain-containing protein [Myxococcales bacterium]